MYERLAQIIARENNIQFEERFFYEPEQPLVDLQGIRNHLGSVLDADKRFQTIIESEARRLLSIHEERD